MEEIKYDGQENLTKEGDFKKSKNLPKRKWKKFFLVFVILITIFFLYIFGDFLKLLYYRVRIQLGMKLIEKQELKYKNDKYGGKTPEETYSMFLDALKKEDIELASKYFVLEKQKEYKKALYEIKERGKWALMMDDLTQEKNVFYEKVSDERFVINIMDLFDSNMLKEQIVLVLPSSIVGYDKPITNIWKILNF